MKALGEYKMSFDDGGEDGGVSSGVVSGEIQAQSVVSLHWPLVDRLDERLGAVLH